jgi:hypothetical protein
MASYITNDRLSLTTRHLMSPVLASPTRRSIGYPVRVTEWIDASCRTSPRGDTEGGPGEGCRLGRSGNLPVDAR